MSQTKDRELLRRLEMISRIKPSKESTGRAMDRARQALLEAAQVPAPEPEIPSKTRFIQLRPLTQVAVAAITVAVMSVGIFAWKASVNRPAGQGLSGKTTRLTINPDLADTERLKLEAGQIQKMIALANTQGLIDMLEGALPASQELIANYLGSHAIAEAMPVLSRLALKWTGPTMANPFAQAVTRIQTRLDTAPASAITLADPDIQEATATMAVAGPSVLNGQVTDLATGEPVAGAVVSVPGPGKFETQTNDKGFYSFSRLNPEGYYRLKVTAQGYLGLTNLRSMPLVSISETKPTTQNVQLQKGCIVAVHVIDQTGQPVRDVSLTASWLGTDHDNIVGQPVVTDTDGQSIVGAVEASEIGYLVTAMHPDFVPQYASIKCSDPLITQSLEIMLTQGQTVPAFAEYSDYVPAEGVVIIARPEWWRSLLEPPSQRVQSDGSFMLTSVAPQTYQLFARIAQEDGSSYELKVAQSELPLAPGEVLHLTLPPASPPVKESILGTFQWVNGVKSDHLTVLAYMATPPNGAPSASQYIPSQIPLTGELDSFEIPNLAPGTYNLLFWGPNVRPARLQDVSTSGDPAVVTLEYVATPYLKGSVLRADSGAPIETFSLELRKQSGLANVLVTTDKRLYKMKDQTGGQFNIKLPGIGTYQTRIQSPGYVPITRTLQITGDDHPLALTLKQGGSIMGRVMDIHGQGVTGASVTAVSQISDTDPVKGITDDGHFMLNTLPEGLVTLRITHPDHGFIDFHDLDVVEDITLDLSMITLYMGATIQGYVLDNAGLPVPHATLFVDDGSEETNRATRRLAKVLTDDAGYYQVSGLPSDLCYIYRRNPSTHTGVVRRSLIGEKETTYDLDFGVGPQVTGSLTEDTGEVLRNVRLLLSHPVNPASPLFQSYAQTDANGRFTFSGVPAGHYGIFRQLPGATTWTQVTIFNMLRDDLDLGPIPPRTSNIQVSLISNANVVTSGWRVLLQQGQALWSPFVKQADQPETGDSRYLLAHVLPGEYCVVAQKHDNSQWVRMPITLLPNSPKQDLIINLPDGHITLSGSTNNSTNEELILFNQDKTLVMPIRNNNGQYMLNHVPPGDYVISNSFLADMAPLEAFTLALDTEAIQLPINTQQWISPGQGLISVQVSGQDGLPLMHAEAWLSNEAGTLAPLMSTNSELIFIAPVGSYELTVSHEGFEAHTEDVTIEPNPQIALNPERPVIPIRLNTK